MDDPNRLRHIFGEPRHNLARLVRLCGSEVAAAEAIGGAVEATLRRGELIVDNNGLYRQVFAIRGVSVTVSGRVVDGVARIGTAWMPP